MELQISIRRTGLCGSDLHYYSDYRNGDIVVREPLILGHEASGIVTAIGAAVSKRSFAIGDSVALEVGVPCDQLDCHFCNPPSSSSLTNTNVHNSTGQKPYNLCPRLRFRSSAKSFPHFQGTLQTALNHPAAYCHKLPSTSSPKANGRLSQSTDEILTKASLLEPLSVALHAAHRAQLQTTNGPTQTILIFGAGAVGLLCAYVARHRGARHIVIADIDRGRVDFAVKGGWADQGYVVPLRKGSTIEEKLAIAKETASTITALPLANKSIYMDLPVNGHSKPRLELANGYSSPTNGATNGHAKAQNPPLLLGEVDLAFECTGTEACVQTSIYATQPGGKVMLVGMGHPVQTLPLSAAALREVDLLGVFRYAGTYREGIEMVFGGLDEVHSSPMNGNARNGAAGVNGAHANGNVVDGVNGLERKERKMPDLLTLVTHRFRGLERAGEAFRMAGRTVDEEGRGVRKVMVELD